MLAWQPSSRTAVRRGKWNYRVGRIVRRRSAESVVVDIEVLAVMAQALVPLKCLVQAKTRMSGLLWPSERRVLALAMLEDVLAVVSRHPDIERVTLVSDDPVADLLVRKYAIDHVAERTLPCRGLCVASATLVPRWLTPHSKESRVTLFAH